MNDIGSGLRRVVKRPGHAATIVAMLALGIGGTTAMVSVFHKVMLEPLAVPSPGGLVNLSAPGPKPGVRNCGVAGTCEDVFSYPMFRDLEASQESFAGIAAHFSFSPNLATVAITTSGTGVLVSGDYFELLGLNPVLGRLIGPSDQRRTGAVAVLSHAFWNRYYDGDTDVVGQVITINGEPFSIIGVAPEGFAGTTIGVHPDVFVPLTMSRITPGVFDETERRAYWLNLFARELDGVSIERATAALNSLYSGILSEIEAPLQTGMAPEIMRQFLLRQIVISSGERGQSSLRVYAREPLIFMLAVALLVLLICCLNVANLQLSQASSRMGETAIRASLGATRFRLTREFLTETGILALLGGLGSLPVAALILGALVRIMPRDVGLSRIDFSIDSTAMVISGVLCIGTILLIGLFPALQASMTQPVRAIKSQASNVGGTGLQRFRRALATGQICLSMILLILAGLFVRSLLNVGHVDLGMPIDSLVTFSVSPALNGYHAQRNSEVFDSIERALAVEPGVIDVATAMVPALSGDDWLERLAIEGVQNPSTADSFVALNVVSPGFFRAMSIPLIAGRQFDEQDDAGQPGVAIVNQAFVDKFGLDGDALGTRFAVGQNATQYDLEIVGIVANAKYSDIKVDAIPPQYFRPRRQWPEIGTLFFLVRTALEPSVIMERVGPIVADIDPNLPVISLETLEQAALDNVFQDRILATLAVGFAALAAFLAAVGLYAVLRYYVEQRTREFGLRLALGATPACLRRLVMSQVGRMALVAIPLGIVAAVLLAGAFRSMLYGLESYDPAVLGVSILTMAIVVLVVGFMPAHRALRVSAVEALRYE